MNLSEIISKYDTPGEKFYESVFASIINQCDEADRNTLAFQAERVAFNLMATYRTDEMTGKKRFLYKPLVCFTDSNGVTHISADIDEITPEWFYIGRTESHKYTIPFSKHVTQD